MQASIRLPVLCNKKARDLFSLASECRQSVAATAATFSLDTQVAIKVLGLILTNPEDIQYRHSYNKYVFKYESFFSEIPLELIIETSFYQDVYPAETHDVYSFVGRFCEKNGITLPIPFDEAKISMQVQSLERTFIDKIFAVCDYRIQNMMDRDSRH